MKREAQLFLTAVLAASVVSGLTQGVKPAAKPGNQPAAAAQASTAGLKCTGDNGAACTPEQLYGLNQGLASGRRMHQDLMAVRDLTAGPNGQLKCTQTNGSACTDAQLSAVIELAGETSAAAKTKNKGGGGFHVTKSIDVASP